MYDKTSCLNDFAAVVNTDPGLTASVLKIVNSAFYGFPRQIEDIGRALNLIGIGQLNSLAVSLLSVKSLKLSNDIEPLTTFWRRSIYCGVLSRLMARNLNLKNEESLFVVGLLHEIGRLILFHEYPKESRKAAAQAQAENRSLTAKNLNNISGSIRKT